jgi:hypothetical protein
VVAMGFDSQQISSFKNNKQKQIGVRKRSATSSSETSSGTSASLDGLPAIPVSKKPKTDDTRNLGASYYCYTTVELHFIEEYGALLRSNKIEANKSYPTPIRNKDNNATIRMENVALESFVIDRIR